ncbi:hypothetical protein PHMEG_00010564 [Phytophthora megakarya]|uniref:Uncharacterized protein n=1 Tax=Phytophthora megakarya TaxID=4795 RepID=A0A225WFF3_9STRA|nr:hypothetical protein PHMEG_00010564 [Phytophthora megakarya]
MAIIIAGALRYSLKQTVELDFETSSAQFGKYLKLNGTSLACNTDIFHDANSTATVFPSFVDVNGALNLSESIAQMRFTQYLYQLGERYVPNNAIHSLSSDYYISSMVIATVLGIAITRRYHGGDVGRYRGDVRRNQLLRLFVYLYVALFT